MPIYLYASLDGEVDLTQLGDNLPRESRNMTPALARDEACPSQNPVQRKAQSSLLDYTSRGDSIYAAAATR